VGAKRILVNSAKFQAALVSELTVNGVEWRFNTPYSPHQDGWWESNVKSVKSHLFKVIGEQLLTYEELTTVLAKIEALLNSRPLCKLSGDSSAPEALTPADFLTLMPLGSLPAENVVGLNVNRLDRFQLVDHIWYKAFGSVGDRNICHLCKSDKNGYINLLILKSGR